MPTSTGIKQRIGLFASPVIAVALWRSGIAPQEPAVASMAAIAVLMAGWWMTEALPIPATALVPVALFPLVGILDGRATAELYFNHVIFLFIGGFVFALAMQRWNLHRRIALFVFGLFGTSPRRLLLGFMIATWFLSMWISNTASTMMIVPMAMAVSGQLRDRCGAESTRSFSVALLLGVAYSASIGGLATLIGTPPNLSLARILPIVFPEAPELSFASWFLFAAPLSTAFLFVAWGVLTLLFLRADSCFEVPADVLREERRRLGRPSPEERIVLALFALLVAGWMFRADIDLFGLSIPGWSGLLPRAEFVDDGTVAVVVALLLFVLPAPSRANERLMDWEAARDLPWGIVLLFGGGFALASGFQASGLSAWLGTQLTALDGVPPLLLVFLICGALTFLTELSSNTATTEMALPVLGPMAVAIGDDPLLLMIPATLSASCAFMLPVATPPNAIAFATGELRMADMVRGGILLNLIGMILITAAVYFLGHVIGIDPGVVPEWARPR